MFSLVTWSLCVSALNDDNTDWARVAAVPAPVCPASLLIYPRHSDPVCLYLSPDPGLLVGLMVGRELSGWRVGGLVVLISQSRPPACRPAVPVYLNLNLGSIKHA